MKDGRQTKGGERAQPADKVVRLPRDWLGPREDLVPFGPGASTPEPESNRSAPNHETPPSASDFWGERSAAIHGALQGPADDPIDVAVGASAAVAAKRRWWVFAELGRRRVLAALGRRRVVAVIGLAIAATVVVWIGSGVLVHSGSRAHVDGAARLNIAAVLSGGLSRTLQRGLVLIGSSPVRSQAPPPARHRAMAIRRTPRARRVFKRAHETTHSHPPALARSAAPAPTPVVRSSPPTTVRIHTPAIVSRTPATRHTPQSSAASVSPTGESGALGPIQSPNG